MERGEVIHMDECPTNWCQTPDFNFAAAESDDTVVCLSCMGEWPYWSALAPTGAW